jgi:hypothetical protein
MKMYEGKTAFPKYATPQAGNGDQSTGSVYGSRFAIAPLPSVDIPDEPMPSGIAYRMVKDKLSLDNNPKLKYVSSWVQSTGLGNNSCRG